jgi:hypothetical protein
MGGRNPADNSRCPKPSDSWKGRKNMMRWIPVSVVAFSFLVSWPASVSAQQPQKFCNHVLRELGLCWSDGYHARNACCDGCPPAHGVYGYPMECLTVPADSGHAAAPTVAQPVPPPFVPPAPPPFTPPAAPTIAPPVVVPPAPPVPRTPAAPVAPTPAPPAAPTPPAAPAATGQATPAPTAQPTPQTWRAPEPDQFFAPASGVRLSPSLPAYSQTRAWSEAFGQPQRPYPNHPGYAPDQASW